MNKQNISRDEIAEAMKNEFGFNRKLCLDIVNDIIENISSRNVITFKASKKLLKYINSNIND